MGGGGGGGVRGEDVWRRDEKRQRGERDKVCGRERKRYGEKQRKREGKKE